MRCRRANPFAPPRCTRADGSLFAQYTRAGQPPPPPAVPPLLPRDGVHIDGERVLVMKTGGPGRRGARHYLPARPVRRRGRVRAYLNVLGAVMVIGLIAALLAVAAGCSAW